LIDYYKILGVQENADQDTIKKAYRIMAKKFHPDKNKDSGAEEEFKKITEAYENIGDVSKRQAYDRKRNHQDHFFGGFSNFDNNWNFKDPFASHYNPEVKQDQKGGHISITLKVTLKDVLNGVEKKIKLRRDKKCKSCDATGAEGGRSFQSCGNCSGSGYVTSNRINGFVSINSVTTCMSCNGSGKAILEYCMSCLGKGLINEEDVIEINVPGGASDGMQFVVSNKGNDGKGNGLPGDLYVRINEIEDENFVRRGTDLIASKQITFIDAVLGINIDVEMPDGEKVKAVVSPGTIPGTVLKFSQKGIPNIGYGNRGDFLVEINIKIPSDLNSDEKRFMEELRDYDMFK
jgi:molecular chaperone DnaJ